MPTKLQLSFNADAPKGDFMTICLIGEGGQIIPSLDQDVAAYLIDAMAALKFNGDTGKTMLAFNDRTSYLLVGIGAVLNHGTAAENLGGQLFSALAETDVKRGCLLDHQLDDTVLADICFGAQLASYHFDKYFTDSKSDDLQVQRIPARFRKSAF
jgi:leucyl aminopeptidase